MVALTVRLVVSLAVVVGLLLLTARLGSRRFRSSTSAPVRVVHRQSLSRSSSIAVIEVGSRTLLIGTTEHQVNLLTDLTDDLPHAAQDAVPVTLEAVRDEEDAAATGSFGPHLAAALASRTSRRPRPVLVTDETADLEATSGTPALEETSPALGAPVALEAAVPVSPVSPVSRPAGAHRRTTPSATRTRAARAASPEPAPAGGTRTASGPLAGSVLSAATWRQAVSVARGRAR